MTRVLLVEPDATKRSALRATLEANGIAVTETADVSQTQPIDVQNIRAVISNASLPSGPGIDLVSRLAAAIILIADNGSVRQAVAAMKRGAADYLVRPFDPDELIAAIERLAATSVALSADPATNVFYPMIGKCPAMLELFDRITKIAPTETTVLIQGESGTGKELVARALHASSSRQQAPMISLNCAAIPETLVESELFGHERGAFTGASNSRNGLVEAAHQGTLFLDEIGELPLEAQARLLRVLQEGEIRRVGATETRQVDVRLIAATHRDLRNLTEAGRFREDLFYRLNVVTLAVPPLRERGDDIIELAQSVLTKTCENLNKPQLTLSSEALDVVRRYHWPGNVRELENVIERAVILCDHEVIEPDLLAIEPLRTAPPTESLELEPSTSLEDYFVNFVLEHQDQLTETELASRLGISRKSLWERRQRLDIPRKRTKQRRPRRDVKAET
jgi:DNA-binding NtrC family response regulator